MLVSWQQAASHNKSDWLNQRGVMIQVDMSKISCASCTYVYENSEKKCTMCYTPNPRTFEKTTSNTSSSSSSVRIDSEGQTIECPNCTLRNDKKETKCNACEFEFDSTIDTCGHPKWHRDLNLTADEKVRFDRIRCLCHNEGWFTWTPGPNSMTLQDFEKVEPNKVNADDCCWISVVSPSQGHEMGGSFSNLQVYEEKLKEIETVVKRIKRVPGSQKKEWADCILTLANDDGYTSGKWLIFLSSAEVNEAWKVVAKLTAEDKLGHAAKVSPGRSLEKPHLICVYISDFTDFEYRMRIRKVLEENGLRTNSFKPDIFTHLGLNSDNNYRLKVTLDDGDDFQQLKSPARNSDSTFSNNKRKA